MGKAVSGEHKPKEARGSEDPSWGCVGGQQRRVPVQENCGQQICRGSLLMGGVFQARVFKKMTVTNTGTTGGDHERRWGAVNDDRNYRHVEFMGTVQRWREKIEVWMEGLKKRCVKDADFKVNCVDGRMYLICSCEFPGEEGA